MAKANLLEVPQSKTTWEARGKLFNTKSEHAFKVNDKGTWRTVNLGLRTADGEVMFFTVKGGEKKTVWMSNFSNGKNNGTKEVAWADRKKEARGGWKAMGVNLGLVPTEENPRKGELTSLTEWDTFDYLKEHCVDDMELSVGGEIEFSTYTDPKTNEVKKFQNFVAKRIYLASSPIDFQDEKFKKHATWSMNIIYRGNHSEEDKKFLDYGLVGWHSYQEGSVEATDNLLKAMKEGGVKLNSSLTIKGEIRTSQQTEKVKSIQWGEEVDVDKARNSGKATLVAIGADGGTLEFENYKTKILDAYIEAVAKEQEEKKNKASAFESQGTGKTMGETVEVSGDATDGW